MDMKMIPKGFFEENCGHTLQLERILMGTLFNVKRQQIGGQAILSCVRGTVT